jgi:hypothetical protein
MASRTPAGHFRVQRRPRHVELVAAEKVLDAAKRSTSLMRSGRAVAGEAEFLRDLTSFTGGRLFEVEKTDNLDAVFIGILEEFRQRYLVSYTPRGVAREAGTSWTSA